MDYLDQDVAHQILSPHYSELVNCIQQGVSRFKQKSMLAIPDFCPTTIASALNDFIRIEIEDFSKKSNTFWVKHFNKAFFMIFDGNYAIRPKKVGCSLETGNIPTKQIELIKNQNLCIPGLENNSVNLVLGYQMDETLLELKSVHLILEKSSGIRHWEIRIDKFMADVQPSFELLPVEQVEEPKRRVKVRTIAVANSDVK